ncbi:MAG: hypothetical protein NVS9B4_28070 [Candidatus Acidiferrum sp.]
MYGLKTHFEQVPLEAVLKIVKKQLKQRERAELLAAHKNYRKSASSSPDAHGGREAK